MAEYTADEIRDARAPLESLLSKSQKSLQKVAPGTWQHTMLAANIQALQVALTLIGGADADAERPAAEQLDSALAALDSMIERVAATETKFAPGTSQHSLQRNRLKALRIARWAVRDRRGETE